MSLLVDADAGTSAAFIQFAKKKLAFWKAQMGNAKVRSFARTIFATDGTEIYINSVALGNGQFRDRIRITGGDTLLVQHDPILPILNLWPSFRYEGATQIPPPAYSLYSPVFQHVSKVYLERPRGHKLEPDRPAPVRLVDDVEVVLTVDQEKTIEHAIILCRAGKRVGEYKWNEIWRYNPAHEPTEGDPLAVGYTITGAFVKLVQPTQVSPATEELIPTEGWTGGEVWIADTVFPAPLGDPVHTVVGLHSVIQDAFNSSWGWLISWPDHPPPPPPDAPPPVQHSYYLGYTTVVTRVALELSPPPSYGYEDTYVTTYTQIDSAIGTPSTVGSDIGTLTYKEMYSTPYSPGVASTTITGEVPWSSPSQCLPQGTFTVGSPAPASHVSPTWAGLEASTAALQAAANAEWSAWLHRQIPGEAEKDDTFAAIWILNTFESALASLNSLWSDPGLCAELAPHPLVPYKDQQAVFLMRAYSQNTVAVTYGTAAKRAGTVASYQPLNINAGLGETGVHVDPTGAFYDCEYVAPMKFSFHPETKTFTRASLASDQPPLDPPVRGEGGLLQSTRAAYFSSGVNLNKLQAKTMDAITWVGLYRVAPSGAVTALQRAVLGKGDDSDRGGVDPASRMQMMCGGGDPPHDDAAYMVYSAMYTARGKEYRSAPHTYGSITQAAIVAT